MTCAEVRRRQQLRKEVCQLVEHAISKADAKDRGLIPVTHTYILYCADKIESFIKVARELGTAAQVVKVKMNGFEIWRQKAH